MDIPEYKWPDGWKVTEIGSDRSIKENESGGEQGIRAEPPELDVAVLIEPHENISGQREKDRWWMIGVQSKHPAAEKEGKKRWLFKTRYSEEVETEDEAREVLDRMVEDLRNAKSIDEVGYMQVSE